MPFASPVIVPPNAPFTFRAEVHLPHQGPAPCTRRTSGLDTVAPFNPLNWAEILMLSDCDVKIGFENDRDANPKTGALWITIPESIANAFFSGDATKLHASATMSGAPPMYALTWTLESILCGIAVKWAVYVPAAPVALVALM